MISVKDNFGIKGLHLQRVESPCSTVNRVSLRMDPFQRYCNAVNKVSHPSLQQFKHLLEWSYGYRNIPNSNKSIKRRSPSAGALYPTELLLLTYVEDAWILLYYSFAEHHFYRITDIDTDIFLAENSLSKTESQLYFVSVFTRSVQKYGVRAYRYAHLDAACISDTIARFYRSDYPDAPLSIVFPSARLNKKTGFHHGEAISFSFILQNRFHIPEIHSYTEPIRTLQNSFSGCAPYASSNLMHVLDFHERALSDKAITHEWMFNTKQETCLDYLRLYSDKRISAQEFQEQPVDILTYSDLCTSIIPFCLEVNKFLGIQLQIISLTTCVSGMRAGSAEELVNGQTLQIQADIKNTMNHILSEACQHQKIMKNTAFTFIIAIPVHQTSDAGTHLYTKSIIGAGLICSKLYHLAYQYNIGTTTIGGFSEKMINTIYGNEKVIPLVVQTFGHTDTTQSKIDAATTLLLNI